MKRKVLLFIVMLLMATCCISGFQIPTAKASEINTGTESNTGTGISNAPLNNISVLQTPVKTSYFQGESLDLTGLIVQGSYSDGTVGTITDYQVFGYDTNLIGNQTITINSQGFSASFNITVLPPKVTNITVTSFTTSSVTLTWNAVPGAIKYEIYEFNAVSGTYALSLTNNTNRITFNYTSGTYHTIEICAVISQGGTEYRGAMSDTFTAATAPEAVTGLSVTGTGATQVSLSWNAIPGATGYIIYRSTGAGKKFSVCKAVNTASYTDKKLSSGHGYQYKVCAYTYSETYFGEASPVIDTSTNAAKVVLKCKAGDQKVRITWKGVTGASYYDIYIGDEVNGYSLAVSRKANYSCKYIVEGLTTGNSYSIYAVARRSYLGKEYNSDRSDAIAVDITEILPTSTEAKYYKTKTDFRNCDSFKDIEFFHKNLNYTKSFIIPGLITTDVNGFSSSTMCPQAITFAGDYLLQTAYDRSDEENSVIYVMDKKSKELLTTIVLPSMAHLGGIAFDGTNVWVSRGTSVSSIQYSQIAAAVAAGTACSSVKFDTTSNVNITASYITYYNDKLWIGTYNELEETKMYGYTIENKETQPSLTVTDTIHMPTRVQGVAFTGNGTLILSRSCQLYLGLRGYMRQIDLYNPDFVNETDGIIALGDLVNSVEMPSMNEGIAIYGSYIYVTYESAAFEEASYQMDHICAFKVSSLLKKQTV